MTDPGNSSAAVTRRTGAATAAVGAVALLAAIVVFWTAGPPFGVNIGAGVLYLVGLLAGLTGTVLLWMGWTRHGLIGTALALVCACPVVTIGAVVRSQVQLVLIAVTAVVLALAALLARRG